MAIAGFVVGFGGGLLPHTLPFVRKSLELTEGDMSRIFAIGRAVSLFAVVFSMVGDRSGRRMPFLVAFALVPITNLLTAVFPSVVTFTVFQSIARVAFVAVAALSIIILAEELTPGVRGYGIGLVGIAGAMGNGTSLVLLPIADSGPDGWRILFFVSGFGLLALPLLHRFLGESRAFVRHEGKVPFVAALQAGLWRYLLPLVGIAFFLGAFSGPAFDFALERLIDDLGWSVSAARFLVIVFSGVGTIGLLIGGRLADVAGRRPTTATAILLGLVGGLAFYTFDSGWLLAPGIFLATLGATMLSPSFAAHRAELFPTRVRATAGAWVSNASILGALVGFGIGAVTIDRIGLSSTITLLGMGLVIAVFLALQLPETHGRDLLRSARKAGERTGSTPG